MKIRTDFVTNSSSSSFYVEKTAEFSFPDDKNTHCQYFEVTTSEGEGHREKNVDEPAIFKKYVNWYYLVKGTKPSASKIVTGKGAKEFAEFLEKTYKKKPGECKYTLGHREYNIGYGESWGNDFRNYNQFIMPFFHPILLKKLNNKEITDLFEKKQCSGWYLIRQKNVDSKGRLHKTYDFNDIGQPFSTEAFYDWIYSVVGRPYLPFSEIKPILMKFNLPKKILDSFEEQDAQVIYACKNGENNVIVYLDFVADPILLVEDIIDFTDENS